MAHTNAVGTARGTPIWLPANRVRAGRTLPRVCPRHGRGGGDCRPTRLTLQSRPPIWMYLTLIAGFVILLIVLLVLRKTVSTSMWPNCALCRSERRKRGVGAWVCFGVWPPAIVIAADVDLGAWPITLSILIPPLLGLAFATQCSWSTITKAVVTDDGQSVCLRSAHPDFVAALPRVPPDGWPAPSAPVALPPTVTGWPDTCQRASNVVVPPWDQASG